MNQFLCSCLAARHKARPFQTKDQTSKRKRSHKGILGNPGGSPPILSTSLRHFTPQGKTPLLFRFNRNRLFFNLITFAKKFVKINLMDLKYLPHFFRIFPAPFLKGVLGVVIGSLLITFFLFTLSPFGGPQWLVFNNHRDSEFHLDLAREYEAANDLANAKRELLIGLSYTPKSEELKKELSRIEDLLAQPGQVWAEIQKWERVTQEYPNYRDAYLKLAQLYYQLYENDKTRENLKKALEIDPNFAPAKEFKKVLNKRK